MFIDLYLRDFGELIGTVPEYTRDDKAITFNGVELQTPSIIG